MNVCLCIGLINKDDSCCFISREKNALYNLIYLTPNFVYTCDKPLLAYLLVFFQDAIPSASKHSHTSTTPLVSNKHSSNPTHLVIPFTSSTPKITTIHIPITSARYRSDSDSSSNSSSEEEGAVEPVPGEGHGAGDGERDGLRGAGGADDIASDGRDADGEDSAPGTPEINVDGIGSRPRSNTGGPSGSKSATESDYEEAAYSVYQHEKGLSK